MLHSIVGWGFALSFILFIIEGFANTQILGIIAIICIAPLAVSIIGAFAFKAITIFME